MKNQHWWKRWSSGVMELPQVKQGTPPSSFLFMRNHNGLLFFFFFCEHLQCSVVVQVIFCDHAWIPHSTLLRRYFNYAIQGMQTLKQRNVSSRPQWGIDFCWPLDVRVPNSSALHSVTFWRQWIPAFPELSPEVILTVDLLTCGAEAAALWSRGWGSLQEAGGLITALPLASLPQSRSIFVNESEDAPHWVPFERAFNSDLYFTSLMGSIGLQ